jgi:DNA-directed RNA polymerase subunit RPC12/RpoP
MNRKGLLKNEFPIIFSKIKNPVNPIVDIEKLTSGSGEHMVWECACGLNYTRAIQVVVKKNRLRCTLCSKSGKSRLEFEVAHLLALFLNTEIEKHHGDSRKDEVDLYVPLLDLAIQLDPYFTHSKKTDVDIRVLAKMKKKYSKVLRVREEGLTDIPNSIFIPKGVTAYSWALKICDFLKIDISQIDIIAVDLALIKANEEWDQSFEKPLELNIKNSIYGKEFVSNLTHPGRKPEYTPRHCSDRGLWKCSLCSRNWDTPISTRKNGIGCPKCSIKIGGIKAAKAPENKSVLSLSPELTKMFKQNLDYPERDISFLRVTSGNLCLWTCENNHERKATVYSMYKNPTCQKCKKQNQPKQAIFVAKTKPLAKTYLFLTKEFATSNDCIFPENILESDNTVYNWICCSCDKDFKSSYRNRVRMLKRRLVNNETLSCLHVGAKITRKLSERTPKISPFASKTLTFKNEFLKNVSQPLIEPLLEDICLWKCKTCNNVWESKLKNRVYGSGCPACSLTKSKKGRMTPTANSALSFKFPDIAKEFIENLSNPERELLEISYNSRDLCIWKCSLCNVNHKAIVYSKTQNYKSDKKTCFHAKKSLV